MPKPNPTTADTEMADLLAEANGILDAGVEVAVPPAPVEPGPFYAFEQVYQSECGNQYRRVIANPDDAVSTFVFLTPGGSQPCQLLQANTLTFDTRAERDAALC